MSAQVLHFPGTRPPGDHADGVATQYVPEGTVIELHGESKFEIIEGVNRAVELLAFDAEVLAMMVKKASQLCVGDAELIGALSQASTAILLAEANKALKSILEEADQGVVTQWLEGWQAGEFSGFDEAMRSLIVRD